MTLNKFEYIYNQNCNSISPNKTNIYNLQEQ